MKKLLVLVVVLLLVGCKPTDTTEQVEEFSFNGVTYVFSDTSRDGYDLFNGDGHLFEVKCEEDCIITFMLDEDIYIITGTSASYEILKNGSTILIDGSDQSPTGIELPDWNEDIQSILLAYKK